MGPVISRNRKSSNNFSLYVLAGLVVLMGWMVWSLCFLHITEPRGPVSAAEAASFASIPIPPQASNIRIAGYSQWIQFEQYVRFEAPVAVCLREAAAVAPGQTLKPVDGEISPSAFPTRKDVFRDLSWFDLPQAHDLVSAGGGPSVPQVWVDRERGVFYYCKTD